MDNVKPKKIIDISTKTFIAVCIMLLSLMVVAIVLTYVIPRGQFETINGVIDYNSYHQIDKSGINIFKGLASPFLNLGTKDGLGIIMLSLFLVVISGAFQIMMDVDGIKVIVGKIVKRFENNKKYGQGPQTVL